MRKKGRGAIQWRKDGRRYEVEGKGSVICERERVSHLWKGRVGHLWERKGVSWVEGMDGYEVERSLVT